MEIRSYLRISNQILTYFLIFLHVQVRCDLKYYVNTIAITDPNTNLILNEFPTVNLEILISKIYLGKSKDIIDVTFIGDFSVSGPHEVGPFNSIALLSTFIKLDRVIGNLKEINLQSRGTDGLLISKIKCTMLDIVYEMKGATKWLDTFDLTDEKLFNNGYESESQKSLSELPASSVLTFSLSNSYQIYTSSGI